MYWSFSLSSPAYVINRMRRSIFLVSCSVFLIYLLAMCEKLPISTRLTTILLFFSISTGCSRSASQRTCIFLDISPELHIIWVVSMINADEMNRRIRFADSTISSFVA